MKSKLNSFWEDRPTLVTGGTGLVGSTLVKRLLKSGADVVCIVRDVVPQSDLVRSKTINNIKIVHGDVCDQTVLERALGEYEIDTVIHLAAQTIVSIANRNPISTFQTNIQGTWALLEACRRSPRIKQVVVASSDKAYGHAATLPYDESTPLRGEHPYDVSKSCSDLIAQSYAKTFDLPVVITRCGNFYGGGDLNWNRIIPGTIRSILRNKRPIIRSDGSCVRDYFFVEDGAAAYMLVAEHLAAHRDIQGEAFNFSNESRLRVFEVVDKILKLMDSNFIPDVRNEASHEIQEQHLNSEKARNVLSWKPLFSLDDGLPKTIKWYQDYLSNGNDS